MDEHHLTEKQRRWLEASKKIGPGAMTKSEKKLLEKLYAEMLPKEQQELYDYIHKQHGKKEDITDEDPIARMAKRVWSEPSGKLRQALGKAQRVKLPSIDEEAQ